MELWEKDINNNGYCDEAVMSYEIFSRPIGKHLTGFFFMDGCHTMRVESDSDSMETLHIQDFMMAGMNCAAIATTRESGFSPKDPQPRLVNFMFTNQSLVITKEFYEAIKKLMEYGNWADAYVYCYLGDPSIQLKP